VTWEVEYTDQFEAWWDCLTEEEQESIVAAEGFLEEKGSALGRPFVDTVKQSRHQHMKELRPMGGNIRILFAFDPRRAAILLSAATRPTAGTTGMTRSSRRPMTYTTSTCES